MSPAMLDMVHESRSVSDAAAEFRIRQADFDRAKEKLDMALAEAFSRLWDGRSGDLVEFCLDGRSWSPGRAVILRNGLNMGLYVDGTTGRYSVPQPFSEHIRPRKARK